MNHRGEVTTLWGDGEHTFMLSVSGIFELEEKCKAPFAVIFSRVTDGTWGQSDIYEALRLGLIGGGKSPVEAKKLVDRYLLPIADNVPVARLVMLGVMFGFEASPVGKPQAAQTEESISASTPQSLPERPDLSASGPMSLDEFHSGNWWR